jgi:ABC-type sugar transport system permease subunit
MADNPTTIRDIDVPFWRIVVILIKWSIAAIPAMIVIAIIYAIIFGLIGGAIMGMMGITMHDLPTPPSPGPQ